MHHVYNVPILACKVSSEACKAADAKAEAGGEAEGTAGGSLALACPHAQPPGEPPQLSDSCGVKVRVSQPSLHSATMLQQAHLSVMGNMHVMSCMLHSYALMKQFHLVSLYAGCGEVQ